MTDSRRFIDGIDCKQRITERDARKKYPSPHFFLRATDAQTKEMIASYVMRNVDEIRRILQTDEQLARGNVAGTVTKRHMIAVANRLHDWRVSMNILSGGLGEPYLWEE